MTGLEADAGQGTQVLRTDNPAAASRRPAGSASAAAAAHGGRRRAGAVACTGQCTQAEPAVASLPLLPLNPGHAEDSLRPMPRAGAYW